MIRKQLFCTNDLVFDAATGAKGKRGGAKKVRRERGVNHMRISELRTSVLGENDSAYQSAFASSALFSKRRVVLSDFSSGLFYRIVTPARFAFNFTTR